ncbi:MAG: SpoIIE family protein phosphatase, partial [Acidobacteriota bacterium]
ADGVPLISWWLLALYLLAGLAALLDNARMLGSGPLRRGALLVFFGALLGLAPFVAAALAWTADGSLPAWALVTMPLLPLSFTYAIVRFQLLDIRIILRRSLVYTALTVLVTGAYAFSIAIFNALFSDSALGGTAAFPVLLALMIAFFFEPLRRRLQEVVDRNMFAERSRLRRAIANLGEALTAQPDAQRVVADLVDRLPDLLGLHFAALYRLERDLASDRGAIDDGDAALAGARWTRVAGPGHLPETLPVLPALHQHLQNRKQRLTHLDQLGGLWLHAPEVTGVVQQLDEYGVESLAELGSQRRARGLLLLSERRSQIAFEREEEALVQQLLDQTSVALETALLLEERTQRAELARELEIAAGIQRDLLPDELTFGDGWQVAAFCRPARDVGGDFVAQLPSPRAEAPAVVFGDVSGKSVSGALMMMAAHEALHALAMIDPEPTRMMGRANQRLYQLGKRSFVAVGYLRGEADGRLVYLLAGQPPLLRRQLSGAVEELPLPPHRIPLGALKQGRYDTLTAQLAPGEMVVACSDGVVEACAPDGSFFGLDRLRATLSGAPDDPQQAVDAVRAALEAFTRGARQYDDQTLVVVRRTGARWRGQRTGRVTLEAIDLRALALGGGSGDPSRADDGDGEAS